MHEDELWLLIETDVEEAMAEHQELDGSYSCDVHVMVGYVRKALARFQSQDTLS